MNNRNLKILQLGNIIAAISTVIINALANIIPIGGNYTGDISDNIPNLFTPAGITFSIWGVIYVLIILFSFYLAKDFLKKDKKTEPFLEKISIFFILASIGNITWIFLWHYEKIVLSILPMLLLFFSLLIIYQRLNIGLEEVSLKDKIFVHMPISVYLGWITVATIANVTAVLVKINWNGFGISEEIWTLLVILVAAIITILILVKRKDYAYSAVIIWALIGIYIKRITQDPIYGVKTQIAYTAIIAAILILMIAISSFFLKIRNENK